MPDKNLLVIAVIFATKARSLYSFSQLSKPRMILTQRSRAYDHGLDVPSPVVTINMPKPVTDIPVKRDLYAGFVESLACEFSKGIVREIANSVPEPIRWATESFLSDLTIGVSKPFAAKVFDSQNANSSTSQKHDVKSPVRRVNISLTIPPECTSASATSLLLAHQSSDASALGCPSDFHSDIPHSQMQDSLSRPGVSQSSKIGIKLTKFVTRFVVIHILTHAIVHTMSGTAAHVLVEEIPMAASLISGLLESD